MTGDAGYTLPDTLAALGVLGLSLAALTTGLSVMARVHAKIEINTEQAADLKRADLILSQALAQAGPFSNRTSELSGDEAGFTFACGATRCGARLEAGPKGLRLVVRRPGTQETGEDLVEQSVRLETHVARFTYFGALTEGQIWPQSSDVAQRLQSISLIDQASGASLAYVKLWIDQPARCQFDVVAQDCR